MDCTLIDQELVAFELAERTSERWEALEDHLRCCESCLANYFEVRRALRVSRSNTIQPSPLIHARLRRMVVQAWPQSRPARTGGALAAIAALLALVIGWRWWSEAPSRPPTPASSAAEMIIDTASPVPLNLGTL